MPLSNCKTLENGGSLNVPGPLAEEGSEAVGLSDLAGKGADAEAAGLSASLKKPRLL